MARGRGIDWNAQPLGLVCDIELARRLGVSTQAVWLQRVRRGIAPYARGTGIDWDTQPLGQLPDCELARKLGCSSTAVYNARLRRGIPSMRSQPRDPRAKELLTLDRLELLHLRYDLSSGEIGEFLGIDSKRVRDALRRFGIQRSRKEVLASPRMRERMRLAALEREARKRQRQMMEEAAE